MSTPTPTRPPLVSVIVPVYNHDRYIGECLRSIAEQQWRDFEVIVIDDGSTDDSARVAAPLCRTFGFHFERQANRGLAATLNRGIDLARGHYVAPTGSDDVWLADKLARQMPLLESHPEIAVCGGNAIAIDADGTPLPPRRPPPPDRELGFDEIFTASVPGIVAPTAVIRRSAIDDVGGYDPGIRVEDIYLWLKLTARGHRIAGLGAPLIRYRKHPASTHRNVAFMTENLLRTYAAYRDHPRYEQVVDRLLLASFIAAAKRDKRYAWQLLRRIPPRAYNGKFARGLAHLLFTYRTGR